MRYFKTGLSKNAFQTYFLKMTPLKNAFEKTHFKSSPSKNAITTTKIFFISGSINPVKDKTGIIKSLRIYGQNKAIHYYAFIIIKRKF